VQSEKTHGTEKRTRMWSDVLGSSVEDVASAASGSSERDERRLEHLECSPLVVSLVTIGVALERFFLRRFLSSFDLLRTGSVLSIVEG
jgi:hypothetical protein